MKVTDQIFKPDVMLSSNQEVDDLKFPGGSNVDGGAGVQNHLATSVACSGVFITVQESENKNNY